MIEELIIWIDASLSDRQTFITIGIWSLLLLMNWHDLFDASETILNRVISFIIIVCSVTVVVLALWTLFI